MPEGNPGVEEGEKLLGEPHESAGEGELTDGEEEDEDFELGISDQAEGETIPKRRKRKRIPKLGEDEEDSEGEVDFDLESLYSDESLDELPVSQNPLGTIYFRWNGVTYAYCELSRPQNLDTIYNTKPVEEEADPYGKKRFLFVCNALHIPPSDKFLRHLDQKKIDLSFHGVDPRSMRAMCEALEANAVTEIFLLSDNFLSADACYHLGLLLAANTTIRELNLSRCRVGLEGIQHICEGLKHNNVLRILNLSKCNIGDDGMRILAPILRKNDTLTSLNLSYNNLSADGGYLLAVALKYLPTLTDLDLAWNNLFDPLGMRGVFRALTDNPFVKKLILRWNAFSGTEMIKLLATFFRRNTAVTYLDISNNRLGGPEVKRLKKPISVCAQLEELYMGKNPLSPQETELLLGAVLASPSLKILDFDDIWVNKSFLQALKKIRTRRSMEFDVRIGGVLSNYPIYGPDYPKVLMSRAKYEAMKVKKKKLRKDIGHLIWTLGDEPITEAAFMKAVATFKAKVAKTLWPELLKQFRLPKSMVDVVAMRKKYLDVFPDSQPPPPKKVKEKKKKGKGKGKGKGKSPPPTSPPAAVPAPAPATDPAPAPPQTEPPAEGQAAESAPVPSLEPTAPLP